MSKNILIVEARFYEDMADALAEGAAAILDDAGCTYERIAVPGVLEVPVAISKRRKPACLTAMSRLAWLFAARPPIMRLSAMKVRAV